MDSLNSRIRCPSPPSSTEDHTKLTALMNTQINYGIIRYIAEKFKNAIPVMDEVDEVDEALPEYCCDYFLPVSPTTESSTDLWASPEFCSTCCSTSPAAICFNSSTEYPTPIDGDIVTLEDFIEEIVRSTDITTNVFLTTLIFLERLERSGDIPFWFTSNFPILSQHKLFLATLIVAEKYQADTYSPLSMTDWVWHAGNIISRYELKIAERRVLMILKYDLWFKEEEALRVLRPLIARMEKLHWDRRELILTPPPSVPSIPVRITACDQEYSSWNSVTPQKRDAPQWSKPQPVRPSTYTTLLSVSQLHGSQNNSLMKLNPTTSLTKMNVNAEGIPSTGRTPILRNKLRKRRVPIIPFQW